MNIRTEVEQLKTSDIYSLMLFALYRANDSPEYSALSQLSYLLDKDSLLKLCQFYGGMTITIPTIKQLESLLNALLLYQYIDIEKVDYESAVKLFTDKGVDETLLIKEYATIKELLKNYTFNSGRD